MRVHSLVERLPQKILTAFRVGDVPIYSQDEIVCHERISGGEKAEVAFDDRALVFSQSSRDLSIGQCHDSC